ncbi:SGNH/GDSL hydrolase family protein [Rhodococcus sp. H29-C3]|uniref:SGNH/GDSL hydrolase family protein n=1 Tax=Rhodococcus sp. H29-C3 TaxID=3046307 RepID=UPI0024BAD293|nr:SGNH/GDSL hydrolase family protein [Rhodococcus sp. H29-C3]MDJ0362574.1 SGNH/GDSL hydrolase family protein [Rhodococcus sp. H29-C3]
MSVVVLTVIAVLAAFLYDNQRTSDVRASASKPYVAPNDPYRPTVTVPEDPRLLFIGDAYTQGINAHPRSEGFASLVSDQLGWPTEIDGVGGTGFTWGGGPDGLERNDYISRIGRRAGASGFAPNILFIQGGQSDHLAAPEFLGDRVTETIRVARDTWPGVQIVVMGPSRPMPGGDLLKRVSTPIAQAALDAQVPFINPLGAKWFTNENSQQYYGDPGGSLLNSDGHAYVADRVLEALQTIGVRNY